MIKNQASQALNSYVAHNLMDFPNWPFYGKEEIEAATTVLETGNVNNWTGEDVRRFEEELEKFTGHKHALAVANGTLALDLTLQALRINVGDEVICTSRSFLASASCNFSVGATPVFADVDIDSQNVTAATIEACITDRTKAVIVVHLAGWACEMTEILELCNRHNIAVIEDCAQAHGGMYKNKPLGSYGKISTWSFCQDKIISTGGEGGCISTNDDDLYRSLWTLKEHGKSFEKANRNERKNPDWAKNLAILNENPGYKWIHSSVGTNARMTGLQAAIGRVQLRKLDAWHAQRTANANYLWSACADIDGVRVPVIPSHTRHACYIGCVFVEPDMLREGCSRDTILAEIQSQGIKATVGACPELYREETFHDYHDQSKRLPVARLLGETCMAFQVHPLLEEQHMERICSVIAAAMSQAVR